MYGVAIVFHRDGLLGAEGQLRLRDSFDDHPAYVAKLRELDITVPSPWEVRVPDKFTDAVRAAKGLHGVWRRRGGGRGRGQ